MDYIVEGIVALTAHEVTFSPLHQGTQMQSDMAKCVHNAIFK